MQRSIRIAQRCCFISLTVSVLLLIWFLFTAAETQGGHIAAGELQEITEFQQLQAQAIVLANGAARAGSYAMLLCGLALFSFLITIVCAALSLAHLRRIENGLDDMKDTARPIV